MEWIGLLTDEQKRAGYFVSQDDDFVWLWRGENTDHPDIIGVWLYEHCRIKDIRDKAQESINETNKNR